MKFLDIKKSRIDTNLIQQFNIIREGFNYR